MLPFVLVQLLLEHHVSKMPYSISITYSHLMPVYFFYYVICSGLSVADLREEASLMREFDHVSKHYCLFVKVNYFSA